MTDFYGRRSNPSARTDEDAAMCMVTYGPFPTRRDARQGTAEAMASEANTLTTMYPNEMWAIRRASALLIGALALVDGTAEANDRGTEYVDAGKLRFIVYPVG